MGLSALSLVDPYFKNVRGGLTVVKRLGKFMVLCVDLHWVYFENQTICWRSWLWTRFLGCQLTPQFPSRAPKQAGIIFFMHTVDRLCGITWGTFHACNITVVYRSFSTMAHITSQDVLNGEKCHYLDWCHQLAVPHVVQTFWKASWIRSLITFGGFLSRSDEVESSHEEIKLEELTSKIAAFPKMNTLSISSFNKVFSLATALKKTTTWRLERLGSGHRQKNAHFNLSARLRACGICKGRSRHQDDIEEHGGSLAGKKVLQTPANSQDHWTQVQG